LPNIDGSALSEAPTKRCPLCEADVARWRTVAQFRVLRCTGCGYAFVDPRPGLGELVEMYRESGGHGARTARSIHDVLAEEERYPNSTIDAARIVRTLAGFAGGSGRLLDVGCGYGFFSREARRVGFVTEAIEISSFERKCAARIAGIEPLQITFEEFDPGGKSYGAILMSQCLEHARDVNAWIRKAHDLLTPSGVVVVAVPNFNSFLRLLLQQRDPFVNPPEHLNYFGARSLRLLLERHSFRVARIDTVSRFPGSAISRRLPGGGGPLGRPAELFVEAVQRPVLRLIDALGAGMFLNVYAVRSDSGSMHAPAKSLVATAVKPRAERGVGSDAPSPPPGPIW